MTVELGAAGGTPITLLLIPSTISDEDVMKTIQLKDLMLLDEKRLHLFRQSKTTTQPHKYVPPLLQVQLRQDFLISQSSSCSSSGMSFRGQPAIELDMAGYCWEFSFHSIIIRIG
jgi:hypothetical protein